MDLWRRGRDGLTGWDWSWFGLDPDDNPIMLRDAGTNEVYALTLER
jgi:hypothetical protein